uniref:DUF7045 domain-containing protein n=1 Tax=Parascaris univalens TaxID=6257 RepID=A0A915AP15_PARUN
YSLSVDCTRKHVMKVTASSCETDSIFETRRYTCLGSWSEQGYLFVYTERAYEKANVCFVTREHKGLLYMSTSGAHCERNYNFTLNSDKTIVLEKETGCNKNDYIVKPSLPSRSIEENSVTDNHRLEFANREMKHRNNTFIWTFESNESMKVTALSIFIAYATIFLLSILM